MRHLIGHLHPVNLVSLKADSIFALAFPHKMTKKLNCHQETTGTRVFYTPKQFALSVIRAFPEKKYLGGEEGKQYIFLWVVGADIFQIIWVIVV